MKIVVNYQKGDKVTMALGDESFYTVDGEEINRDVLVQKMIDFFNGKYPDSDITDFNEGSQIRNALEALASLAFHIELNDNNILRAVFLSTSYGRYLDLFGEELNRPRDTGSVSTGTVVFTIPEAATQEIIIPDSTVLLDNTEGIEFLTNGDVVISVGETQTEAVVNSVIIGSFTNVGADKITVFRDNPVVTGLTVTNPETCTGGRDAEMDDEYRERLLKVRAEDNFGSIEHYINLGMGVDGVHDVVLTDSTDYTGKIIVNGDNKPLPEDVLINVASVYNTQANLVYNQTFEVKEVGYTTVDLEMTVGVTEEVDEEIFTDVLTLLFDGGYFESASTSRNIELNYQGLDINESLTNYQILTIIEALKFVVQVTSLTSNNESFQELSPAENTVLRLGEVTVTQDLVEE